jgi:hypothetical protein
MLDRQLEGAGQRVVEAAAPGRAPSHLAERKLPGSVLSQKQRNLAATRGTAGGRRRYEHQWSAELLACAGSDDAVQISRTPILLGSLTPARRRCGAG